MRPDHTLSLLFFVAATVLTVAGSALSVIYNISAMTYNNFEISDQTHQDFRLMILVYTYLPSALLLFISYSLHRILWRLLIIIVIMLLTFVLNVIATLFYL